MTQRESNRRAQPLPYETGWILLACLLLLLFLIGAAVYVSALLNPNIRTLPTLNPVSVFGALTDGTAPAVPAQVTLMIVLIVLILAAAAAAAVAALRGGRGRGRSRVDYKSRYMASERDLHRFFHDAALKDAQRLHSEQAGVGVTLAKHQASNRRMYASWEWVQIWLMGPRAGKTSCVCIPQVLETSGPVLATSNKRDIVDYTRGPRSELGVAWVHDVQGIIGEPPSWWWNPLSFVKDYETAEKLADVFQSSAESANAKQDAYFSAAAKETLSRLFLAAALDNRPITDVFHWANNPDDRADDPARILVEHGEQQHGKALGQTQNLTEKQRDGVYGSMRPWLTPLGNHKTLAWITDPSMSRPHFDPRKFVQSTDTLYLVSREGGGSARAITAALTMATLTAAQEIASRSPGGRLKTPLTAVLDEAANVCRWRELPDIYSFFGSMGIIISTFFQSWQQGVEAFGETGMGKLWSAANVRVVGSGLSEDKYLPFVSQSIGDYDAIKRSRSNARGGSSTSDSIQRERIFDVADLTALPQARAIMMATQTPPALLTLEHYSERPYADKVAASRDFYESRAVAA